MPKKPKTEEIPSPKQSRYERVRQILDDAQGDVCPGYQGHKEFWRLPLAEFLGVSIYGVRMIAAAGGATALPVSGLPASSSGGGLPVMSCCHSDEAPPAPAESEEGCCSTPAAKPKKFPGRGAASGLIKGLRGEYPFNGSQFPRLMWGSDKTVSSGDIQFISDWIDDGCPETDEDRSAIEVRESVIAARARGDEDHPISTRSINDQRHESGGTKYRKNIECLTPDELQRFRSAVGRMQGMDKFPTNERSFAYWGQIHANSCQHGWEEFLTWHRAYLYFFEQQLQDIDPAVTVPYWDWTYSGDEANFQESLKDISAGNTDLSHVDRGIIPEVYRCWIDQAAFDRLKVNPNVSKSALSGLQKIIRNPDDNPSDKFTYNSGNRLFTAAGIIYGNDPNSDTAIMEELKRVNPLWYRQRWPGGNHAVIFQAYPKPEDIDNVLKLENFFSFGSGPSDAHYFGAVEQIHNLIHNYTGGVNPYPKASVNNRLDPPLGDMTAPTFTAYDPLFWGHHSNVDRLWAEWQQRNPNKTPDNLSAILPPWRMTVADTLSASRMGYEYIKSSALFETESSVPITRFKSVKANVHPAALASHSRAEIRLHNVQYSVNGGTFIRVFLNSPNADVNTPTVGNVHFVDQLSLFSGTCIGGPGHCDPPSLTQRKFDLRPRHRKTPFNIKLDVTEDIRRLRQQGETDFHINLVVMDITGKPKSDSLWLDAVSLTFID